MYQQILNQLAVRERQITLDGSAVIKESLEMVQFLKDLLKEAKGEVQQRGFMDQAEEIYFFREVQPQMVSRLIFYNEVYQIESKATLLSTEAAKKF
ncbi:RteC domain-containing protein, partial [Capnocytophaga gingivalis]